MTVHRKSTSSKPRFWLGQGLHGLSTLLRMPQLDNIFPQDKNIFWEMLDPVCNSWLEIGR
jgi:hypothetical protein